MVPCSCALSPPAAHTRRSKAADALHIDLPPGWLSKDAFSGGWRIDEDPPRPELNRGGGRDRFSTSRRNWSVALGNRSMSARQKPQNGSAPGALRIAVAGRRKRITPR